MNRNLFSHNSKYNFNEIHVVTYKKVLNLKQIYAIDFKHTLK